MFVDHFFIHIKAWPTNSGTTRIHRLEAVIWLKLKVTFPVDRKLRPILLLFPLAHRDAVDEKCKLLALLRVAFRNCTLNQANSMLLQRGVSIRVLRDQPCVVNVGIRMHRPCRPSACRQQPLESPRVFSIHDFREI